MSHVAFRRRAIDRAGRRSIIPKMASLQTNFAMLETHDVHLVRLVSVQLDSGSRDGRGRPAKWAA